MFEAKGDCVEVSISEYAEECDTSAELENTAVSSPDTVAELEIDRDEEADPLRLIEAEVESDVILDKLADGDPDPELVKYETVCIPEFVVVVLTLIV